MKKPDEKFDWDEVKALANVRKHGVVFKSAIGAFYDPLKKVFHDCGHDGPEDRWIVMGNRCINGRPIAIIEMTTNTKAGNILVR